MGRRPLGELSTSILNKCNIFNALALQNQTTKPPVKPCTTTRQPADIEFSRRTDSTQVPFHVPPSKSTSSESEGCCDYDLPAGSMVADFFDIPEVREARLLPYTVDAMWDWPAASCRPVVPGNERQMILLSPPTPLSLSYLQERLQIKDKHTLVR